MKSIMSVSLNIMIAYLKALPLILAVAVSTVASLVSGVGICGAGSLERR